MSVSSVQVSSLLEQAKAASKNAYAPYSKFNVGAAALLKNGDVVTGVNVENASYGLTQCAERNLLNTLISMGYTPPLPVLALAVWAVNGKPEGSVTPCGACRQVLLELLEKHTPIIYKQPGSGNVVKTTPAEMLPGAFTLMA